MIGITNGLLPDLKAREAENKEKKKKQQKIIAEFSYDNTLEETDDAIRMLQKNFSSKKGIISIVAYSVLAAAAVAALVFNPSQWVLYIALLFCALGLFNSLTAKMRMRRTVLDTISKMPPEDYHCTIFDNRVEIETIIKQEKEAVENIEESAEESPENAKEEAAVGEEEVKPIKSVFKYGEDMLDFLENNISMFLVVGRRQVYCFPKRCVPEEQQSAIRAFLTDKLASFDF